MFVYGTKTLTWDSPCTIHRCMLTFVHPDSNFMWVNKPRQTVSGFVAEHKLTNLSQSSTLERKSQPYVLRTSSSDLTLQHSVFVTLKYQTSWQSDVHCRLRHVHSSGSFSSWFSWNVSEHKHQNSSQPKCSRMAWIFPLQMQPASLHNL